MRAQFVCTLVLRTRHRDDDADHELLMRVYVADRRVFAELLTPSGGAETRWIDAPANPDPLNIGPGEWAVTTLIGQLWVSGVVGHIGTAQAGAIGEVEVQRALQFVKERAPTWVDFHE